MVNYKFKILLGLAMIHVVLGHTGVLDLTFGNILPPDTFHIALFLFISGYFYKDKYHKNRIFIKNSFIYKKTNRLLLPFFIWSTIYYSLMKCVSSSILDNRPITPPLNIESFFINQFYYGNSWELMVAAWFLIYLFLTSCLYFILRRFLYLLVERNKTSKYIDILLIFLLLLLCLACIKMARTGLNQNEYNLICRIGFGLFFYHIGYVYKLYIEQHDLLPDKWYFLIILTILFFIHLKYGDNIKSIIYNSNYSLPAIPTIICALSGIAFWLRIAIHLEPILSKNKYFLYFCDHTFSVMMHQGFFIFLFKLFLWALLPLTGHNSFDLFQYIGSWHLYLPNGEWIRFYYALIGLAGPCICCLIFDNIYLKLKS